MSIDNAGKLHYVMDIGFKLVMSQNQCTNLLNWDLRSMGEELVTKSSVVKHKTSTVSLKTK